jgi:MFS family permease
VIQLAHNVVSMSTATCAESTASHPSHQPDSRIMTAPLAMVLLAAGGTLTSFFLLLSVTPMYAAAAGGGPAVAGLVTGSLLLGTVAAELAASALMRRFGGRSVLAAGALLLGVPTLALLFPASIGTIFAVSVVRGLGFGASTVVTGTVVPALVPPGRRGEGIGLAAIAEGIPAVVALPSGVWLAGHAGFPVVIAITTVTALVALLAIGWVPASTGRGTPPEKGSQGPAAGPARLAAREPSDQPAGLVAALRHGGQLPLFLVFASTTVAAGIVAAFLPLARGVSGNVAAAGLLAQAGLATGGSWWAGRHGDRHGHLRLLVPGLVMASAGLSAMLWLATPAVVIAAMCLFGTGFGIIENATFALMLDRVPASGFGTASSLWNLAYDAGYGAGPVVFGLFAGRIGYPAAFALTSAVMLAALPAVRRLRCEPS